MPLFFNIGFLPITIWDIIDILVVGYILYEIYKLLKGSLAFNIFAGLTLVYISWWIVDALGMSLLSLILGQFVSLGMILLLIVFQPEVRRFLLYVGRTMFKRRPNLLKQLFRQNEFLDQDEIENEIKRILIAVEKLSATKTGALMVFSANPNLLDFAGSGVVLNANLSARLIESIFHKESPLHDGAMIISDGKIHSVGAILPVSDNINLPKSAGLRHRAGLGATEGTDVLSIIVSEETGRISYARKGKLAPNINQDRLHQILKIVFSEFYNR